jgi:hypothetical protein
MGYEQPTYTDEEILASTLAHAAHWENEARYSTPDGAFACRVRTIAECLQMDMLERDVQIPEEGR